MLHLQECGMRSSHYRLGRQCRPRQAQRPMRPWQASSHVTPSVVDSGQSTSAPASREYRYTVRHGTKADARSLAYICAESFGRGNFPGIESPSLDLLEDRYARAIEEDMELKVLDAIDIKEQAAREHRQFRLQQHVLRLRAQLAALRGEPARFVAQLSPEDMRSVQRWQRNRQFLVFVAAAEGDNNNSSNGSTGAAPSASRCINTTTSQPLPPQPTTSQSPPQHPDDDERSQSQQHLRHHHQHEEERPPPVAVQEPQAQVPGGPTQPAPVASVPGDNGPGPSGRKGATVGGGSGGNGGEVVGCATLSLMQPEALLPPPFPSTQPFRLYISNMAVLPGHRRRGLAKRLLQQCERAATLWGHTSLWLHVQKTNAGAFAMYRSMGYRPVPGGGLRRFLPGPLAQVLLCKDLPARSSHHSCPGVLGRRALGSEAGDRAGGEAGEEGLQDVTRAMRPGDGVFVWGAQVGEGPEGPAKG